MAGGTIMRIGVSSCTSVLDKRKGHIRDKQKSQERRKIKNTSCEYQHADNLLLNCMFSCKVMTLARHSRGDSNEQRGWWFLLMADASFPLPPEASVLLIVDLVHGGASNVF